MRDINIPLADKLAIVCSFINYPNKHEWLDKHEYDSNCVLGISHYNSAKKSYKILSKVLTDLELAELWELAEGYK